MRVKGAKNKPDPNTSMQRFVKFQRLRWLIIDECSTAALEVLAALEKHLQDAVRPKNSWKCRKSGAVRPFAGINVLIAGDCWQFPAVKATSIFQNPFRSGQSLSVTALQKILWTHNQNNVQHLFELTKEHRCTDPWLSAILKEARRGTLNQELWSFLHGYPTLHPGSWDPTTNTCGCKNPTCEGLPKIWTQEVLHGSDARTWAARLGDECNVCSAERRRRCVVAESSDFGPNPKDPKFLHAPFIHGLNAAKYVAALLRARWVAAEQNQLLLWAVAQDTPLFHTDPDTDAHELRRRKENWLQRHDQSTGGIMGLLPLLPNMPVRITQTLPELKPFGLFKNTRGQLYNWTLHPEDVAAIQTCSDSDWVLRHLPTCIFVAIPGATWQHRPGLPAGVACIRPGVQHWQLEAHGQATVARKGFPIACDYAGTAHSFMGATLAACSLDLGFWDSSASRDSQLSAYMCLSRVKRAEDVCIARTFSPNLLSQGELIGPETFLQVHRQKLTLNEAKSRFEKDQVQRKRNTETLLFCRGCSPKAKGNQGLLPIREFADNNTWDPEGWYAIVQLGMERMCSQCRESRKPQPQTAPGDQPVGAEEPSVPCAFCTVTKLPKLGFCQKCLATERLACAKCDVGMKLKRKTLAAFSPEEIQRRKRTKELRRARCVKCALVRPNVAKGNVGHCDLCQKSISVSHFHKYDSASKTGICRRCAQKAAELKRAAAKVCPQCSLPLHAAATPGTWCRKCAYPPCAGCEKVERCKKGSNHAKHRPFWRCETCAAHVCTECAKKPVGPSAGPDAVCPQCKPNNCCPKCKAPTPATANLGSWCQACAYPPCSGGCGAPRPCLTGGKYHAKQLPTWTCQACSAVVPPKKRSRTTGPVSRADAATQEPDLPPLPPPASPPPDRPNQSLSDNAFAAIPKRRKTKANTLPPSDDFLRVPDMPPLPPPATPLANKSIASTDGGLPKRRKK